MAEAPTDRALDGVRVLDLSRVLAGPWATQLLADLGADVVKIERPDGGDDTRHWGPPWYESDGVRESAYFTAANRGKRSIAVDFTTAQGAALVKDLASHADVLVENFKVGGLAAHDLDYATLSALNPRLIYCSITGFGQNGPYATRPGYDFLIQAMGGLMSVTGHDGQPGVKSGVAIVDILTGLYASNGILAALMQRVRTGRGQHIDVALLDTQIATLANQAANYLATGVDPERLGNAHPNIVPYQSFATADGDIAVALGNDRQFRRLCALLKRPDLADDPDFGTNAGRVAHRSRLVPLLASLIAMRRSEDLLVALNDAGLPAGPVNPISAVFADSQVRARGLQIAMPHRGLGSVPGVACPLRMSASPARHDLGPPMLGQDQDCAERLWRDDAERLA